MTSSCLLVAASNMAEGFYRPPSINAVITLSSSAAANETRAWSHLVTDVPFSPCLQSCYSYLKHQHHHHRRRRYYVGHKEGSRRCTL